MKALLEMKGISKSFPGVKALDHVDFRIYEGEVMGFLGENGAGKSTLMKILSGIYQRDEGEIIFQGEPYEVKSPKEAMDLGIAIIHQELNLVGQMAIYENIFLGRELGSGMGLDKETMIAESKRVLDLLNVKIDPRTKVENLSVAKQQMVEIARALSMDAKIIIMDEPTDTLTNQEVEQLFKVIHRLKDQNKGMVFISHRLEEVLEICDRYIVLRDGKFIGERIVADSSEDEMIQMMVGRTIEEFIPYVDTKTKDVSLELKDVSNEFIHQVSFQAHRGEVLGIAGLVGAGRTELAKTIFGIYPIEEGAMYLDGEELHFKNSRDAIDHNIVYVSEDRKGEGLVIQMDVKNNMTLSSLAKFIKTFTIDKKRESEVVEGYIENMRIRTPSYRQIIENLSGGNQQKVAIAKALMIEMEVLILDEPTRGVDVGAKKEIYDILNQIKLQGKTIIVISSEMPEILGLSDRILVMNDGKIKGCLDRDEATQEKIMQLIVQGENE